MANIIVTVKQSYEASGPKYFLFEDDQSLGVTMNDYASSISMVVSLLQEEASKGVRNGGAKLTEEVSIPFKEKPGDARRSARHRARCNFSLVKSDSSGWRSKDTDNWLG